MNRFWKFSLTLAGLAMCSISALAQVTVNSPANWAVVSPQFTLSASAGTCSNQTVVAMGFSLDSSSNNTLLSGASIYAAVTATGGAHTLHVKAWGNAGAVCDTDVAISVDGVSVQAPGNGSTVSSPFTLTANSITCDSQPVSAMGYSIDTGSTVIVDATAMSTSISAGSGAHTLHVKSWGNAGGACDTDVAVTVADSAASSTGGVSVSSPGSNAAVSSPFTLQATSPSCSSQTVTAMGYSLDSSNSTAIVYSTSVAASVTASAGAHTLHVKSWGNAGGACDTDVPITVTASASADISSNLAISSPSSGATVNSSVSLAASASVCSSQTVTAMGYNLDSTNNTIVYGSSINTQVSAGAGQHTLYVTAWGASGSACYSSVVFSVGGASAPYIPSGAAIVSSIQTLSNWNETTDTAADGPSTGAMALVGSPSLSGNAREYYSTYTQYGGERYEVNFGDDTTSTNFVYDAWVYINNTISTVANLEMDLNQVMTNGETVIFGFQCDGWNGTWDYTENAGSPTSPVDRWVPSSASCNVHNWAQNTWHHVQVSYSRDGYGNVNYQSVWLDGNEQQINVTVPSAFALGWGPSLITNFQVDSLDDGWGSSAVFIDNITVSRW